MLSVIIEFFWLLFLIEEKYEMFENLVFWIFFFILDDRRFGVVDKFVKEGGVEVVIFLDGLEFWWVMFDMIFVCNLILLCVFILLLYKSVVIFVDFLLL